jgi:hypothetical protein
MPRFKYRDLLIDLFPQAVEACKGCTLNITAPPPCPFRCTEVPSGACLPCTDITNVRAAWLTGPEDLAVLKQRLQEALAEIETRERALEEQMRPRSVAEAEALERGLNEALDTLQVQKAELQREEVERSEGDG